MDNCEQSYGPTKLSWPDPLGSGEKVDPIRPDPIRSDPAPIRPDPIRSGGWTLGAHNFLNIYPQNLVPKPCYRLFLDEWVRFGTNFRG